MPSAKTVLAIPPFVPIQSFRVSGVVTRSRPAWESQTLSYWPSSRTGAGVSSSASSSPGTS